MIFLLRRRRDKSDKKQRKRQGRKRARGRARGRVGRRVRAYIVPLSSSATN